MKKSLQYSQASRDAVHSEGNVDRIFDQLIEARIAATRPASAAAIAALPKKIVDKPMLGSDGTADCSICLDVSLGEEVTVLPCNHWFHGDCVGTWLRKQNTCPHCRQGIMPRKSEAGDRNCPRSEAGAETAARVALGGTTTVPAESTSLEEASFDCRLTLTQSDNHWLFDSNSLTLNFHCTLRRTLSNRSESFDL